jgi:hypothetical protein
VVYLVYNLYHFLPILGLTAIEATIDDLLGAYTKAEDEAMNIAFGAYGKKAE